MGRNIRNSNFQTYDNKQAQNALSGIKRTKSFEKHKIASEQKAAATLYKNTSRKLIKNRVNMDPISTQAKKNRNLEIKINKPFKKMDKMNNRNFFNPMST